MSSFQSAYFPLCIAILFFLFSYYFNSVMQVYAQHNAEAERSEKPLPDKFHDLLPHLTFYQICDWWLISAGILTFLRFFLIPVTRIIMLRRFLFIQGIVVLLRGISIYVTRLNVPIVDCEADVPGSPYIEAFYVMVGIHRSCADVLYSGHTASLTLLALMWTHYSRGEEFTLCCPADMRCVIAENDAVSDPTSCTFTYLLVWTYAIMGYFWIISTHFHYTVDVLIGFTISICIFYVYHYYIKTVMEKRGPIASFFRWFEGFDNSLAYQSHAEQYKSAKPITYESLKSYGSLHDLRQHDSVIEQITPKHEIYEHTKFDTLTPPDDSKHEMHTGISIALLSGYKTEPHSKPHGIVNKIWHTLKYGIETHECTPGNNVLVAGESTHAKDESSNSSRSSRSYSTPADATEPLLPASSHPPPSSVPSRTRTNSIYVPPTEQINTNTNSSHTESSSLGVWDGKNEQLKNVLTSAEEYV